MNKIRLIIIEEHAAVRHALWVRLQSSSNLEVVAAYPSIADWKAQQRISSAEATTADVVLLGLKSQRPRLLNAIIKEIKQLGTAVIVLASFADDIERELILEAGAKRYLLKDINSIQLIAEIETLAAAHPG